MHRGDRHVASLQPSPLPPPAGNQLVDGAHIASGAAACGVRLLRRITRRAKAPRSIVIIIIIIAAVVITRHTRRLLLSIITERSTGL